MQDQQDELLRAKLNQETATIPWRELERFFAAGKVIAVDDGLDLVQVAAAVSRDDKAAVEAWIAGQRLVKVSDEQAGAWLEADALVWAVVVSPWILVQRDKGDKAQRVVH